MHHNLLHSWMYGKMYGEKNNSIRQLKTTDNARVSIFLYITFGGQIWHFLPLSILPHIIKMKSNRNNTMLKSNTLKQWFSILVLEIHLPFYHLPFLRFRNFWNRVWFRFLVLESMGFDSKNRFLCCFRFFFDSCFLDWRNLISPWKYPSHNISFIWKKEKIHFYISDWF